MFIKPADFTRVLPLTEVIKPHLFRK